MSYEVLESKVTHKGFLVTVTMDKIQMPDGTTAMRESVIRGKNAAAVLPVENDGTIIFVRQYRHAFGEMLLEIPAGVMNDEEPAEVGIARELEEETGVKNARLVSEDIFSLEVLPVSGHEKKGKYVPSHLHLNITYLAEANENEDLTVNVDENKGVKWFAFDEALQASKEEWFVERIYKKLIKKVRELDNGAK